MHEFSLCGTQWLNARIPNPAGQLMPQCNTIRAIVVIVCGSDNAQLFFMNNTAAMPGSVTAVRHEFQWKYREFGSFVL